MITAIVTPVKDEEKILDKFFNCITSQKNFDSLKFVIVNNESKDNSVQIINNWINLFPNNIFLSNFSHPQKDYMLGEKYSSIIDHGFKVINEKFNYDFIGILDSDCFIEEDYYHYLLKHLIENPSCGLSSGVPSILDAKKDGELKASVRGNCRVWQKNCFEQSGYLIGPSADTLSLGLAEINGWKPFACSNAKLKIREMGARIDYSYYGYSTYYRGIDFFVATIKIVRLAINFKFTMAIQFAKGYFLSVFKRKPRLNNLELRSYFRRISYVRAFKIFFSKH